jgi:hypothetical protein
MAETRRTDLRRRTLGRFFSEGARRAWVEMERRGWHLVDLRKAFVATKLGSRLHGGEFDRTLYGDKKARIEFSLIAHEVLGIAHEAWAEPPKVPFVLPAARPVALDEQRHESVDDLAAEQPPRPSPSKRHALTAGAR